MKIAQPTSLDTYTTPTRKWWGGICSWDPSRSSIGS